MVFWPYLIVSIAFVFCGLLLINYGRGLPAWREDTDRDDSFLYEFLYGPPGYNRVRAILGGAGLTVGGVIGIILAIVA